MNSLKKIDWYNLESEEFIPESALEEEIIAIPQFTHQRKYSDLVSRVSPNALARLVDKMPHYESLQVAKAFWREGTTYFSQHQYVLAYYHFYFVIEDFFAQGKTGIKSVLSEFAKSTEFDHIANVVLEQTFSEEYHKINLLRFFSEENCEVSPKGLQKLLYHIRGNLHHYYSRSIKTRGTPFNQQEYETPALVAMQVATIAIGFREAAISQSL